MRNLMMVLTVLAAAGPARAIECPSVSQVNVEVVGVKFPTLPAPLVSIQTRSVVSRSCGGPAQEGSAGATQRVTMTVRQARALGQRLIAWSSAPTHTQTLLDITYPPHTAAGPTCEVGIVEIQPTGGGGRVWARADYSSTACGAAPTWTVAPAPAQVIVLLSLQPRVLSPDGRGHYVELRGDEGLYDVTATSGSGDSGQAQIYLSSGQN